MKFTQDTFIAKLESLGFEGCDISLEISLFEYGFVYQAKNSIAIYCRVDPDNDTLFKDMLFAWTIIDDDDIIESVECVSGGFWSYADIHEKDLSDVCDMSSNEKINIIEMIDSYNGWHITNIFFGYDADDVLQNMKIGD